MNVIVLKNNYKALLIIVLAVLVAAELLGVAAVDPARAAFPGTNGKIAFDRVAGGNDDVYTINADGTGLDQLTNDPTTDEFAAFSPDGKSIAFNSNRSGNYYIYTINATGGGALDQVTKGPDNDKRPNWSPDGKKIVFTRTAGTNDDVYTINADGTGLDQLTNDPGDDTNPAF